MANLFDVSDLQSGFANVSYEFRLPRPEQQKMTARELLERSIARIEQRLENQPKAKAVLLETIGNVFRDLGLYSEAKRLLHKSLELRHKHDSENLSSIALVTRNLAWSEHYAGDFDSAKQLYERALELMRLHLPADSPEVATTQIQYALLLSVIDEFDRAETLIDKAIEWRMKYVGQESQGVAIALASKAAIHLTEGDDRKAQRAIYEAFEILKKYSQIDPGTVLRDYQQGIAALERGESAEAAKLLTPQLRRHDKSSVANIHSSLGG